MKILIIEDDKEINRLLSVFLTQNGYDTESTESLALSALYSPEPYDVQYGRQGYGK